MRAVLLIGVLLNADPAIDKTSQWVALVGTTVALLLGAVKLGSMILTRHRSELDEQRARQRFGLYFPEEGVDSPLSIPNTLARGEARFAAIDGKLAKIVDGMVPRDEVERRFDQVLGSCDALGSRVGKVETTLSAHTAHEEDLAGRLERLVAKVLDRLPDDPDPIT